MYKSELEKKIPAVSELIEPAFAHMIGAMGARYLAARDLKDFSLMVECARDLWAITETMELQTIFLSTTHHAGLAISNERSRIADMIKTDLGFNPILDRDSDGNRFQVIDLVGDSFLKWREKATEAKESV